MNATRAATVILLPTLTLAAIILAGSAKPLQAAARALPTASVAGIMVNHSVAESHNGMPALAFQGTQSKTRLAIVVESPEGGIIGFNRDSSEVLTFGDSTGQSLIDPKSPFGPFAFGERVVQGGQRLVVELGSDEAPNANASTVSATGRIDVQIAHEKRRHKSTPFALKPGEVIEVGPYELTVKAYAKSSWNDEYELELSTGAPIEMFTEVVAILGDGTRLELDTRSTMSFDGTTQVSYATETPLKGRVSLEVETWHEPKVRRVPFRVEARVGMK